MEEVTQKTIKITRVCVCVYVAVTDTWSLASDVTIIIISDGEQRADWRWQPMDCKGTQQTWHLHVRHAWQPQDQMLPWLEQETSTPSPSVSQMSWPSPSQRQSPRETEHQPGQLWTAPGQNSPAPTAHTPSEAFVTLTMQRQLCTSQTTKQR